MAPLFPSSARAPGGSGGGGLTLTKALLLGCLLGGGLSSLKQFRAARESRVREEELTYLRGPDAPAQLQPRIQPVVQQAASPPPPPSPPPPSPQGSVVSLLPPPARIQSVAPPLEPSASWLAPAAYPSIRAAVGALSAGKVAGVAPVCHARGNSDLGGELAVGVPQQGDANPQQDAGACCASCQAQAPRCNVWVWHNVTRACWLKHAAHFPERPWAYFSPGSPWTGGSLFDYGPSYVAPASAVPGSPPSVPTCVHTVLTSNGNSYMNWQTRVMYATWQAAAAAEPGSTRVMTAFTRVLHRTTDDELMTEVPTVRIDPARPACDSYCDFPVADRAAALASWALREDARRCSHIMMVETDYLFVRAVPRHILPVDGHAVGFHFGYIAPEAESAAPLVRKYLPDTALAAVPQTGNSPQLLTQADFKRMMPAWRDMHARLEADAEAVKEFNWVRDMYSYSFAAALSGVRHHVPLVPYNPLMVQPPADVTLGEACILHYTWGPIINVDGVVLWSFDKRSYGGGQGSEGPVRVTLLPQPPAWQPGMRLQANETVTEDGLALMKLLVDTFNAAAQTLSELPKGWTDRAAAVEAARPRAVGA